MNRSRRTNRFGVGRGLRSLLGRRKGPSRLAEAAGAGPGAGPEQGFEALENRQLLFTLTITSVDPFTGVGTAFTDFAYFIPYFVPTTQVTASQPTATVEDLNQLRLGAVTNNSRLITDNAGFLQSGLRVDFTMAIAPAIIGAGQQERFMRLAQVGGEEISFSLQPTNFEGLLERQAMRQFAFDDLAGFDPNNFTVDLLYAGQLILSFTGQALANLATNGRYNFPNVNPTILSSIAAPSQAFDQVRIRANAGAPSTQFDIDNIGFTTQTNQWSGILDGRTFGATVAFTGPIGASVTFLDLYDRDIRIDTNRVRVNFPSTAVLSLVPYPPGIDPEGPIEMALGDIGGDVYRGDRNLDGVPDFNDGIGKVIMSGVDSRSAVTIFGGTPGFTPATNAATFVVVDSILGFYDDFEGGGFGYEAVVNAGQATVGGLPPGPGSVLIGSPFVRPQGAGYNPAGFAPPPINFSNPNQGFFVLGGEQIGSVYTHGIVYGFSQFSSTIDRLVIGSFMGSVNVAGDMGSMLVGSDSGTWSNELPGVNAVSHNVGSAINVGRTLGELSVAGRLLSNVTVIGDLTAPALHPPRDIFRYFEKEYAQLATPGNDTPAATIQRVIAANGSFGVNDVFGALGIFFGRTDQSLVFGDGYYRNDLVLSAEWIGSAATAAEIHGEVGFGDGVNTAEDPSDVFGFAADGTRDIEIQLDGARTGGFIAAYMRIVDSDGRTVAAPQFSPRFADAVTMRFRPNAPGVYYLVVTGRSNGTPAVAQASYVLNIAGMAPNTAGQIRSGATLGSNTVTANTINILSGALGSLRVATAFVNGGGGEVDPTVILNPNTGQSLDQMMTWQRSTVTVATHVYNITTGGDVGDTPIGPLIFLTIGGNLGSMLTGISGVVGTGPEQGDLDSVSFSIGGSIAVLDIRGGVGIEQDGDEPAGVAIPNSVVLRTGRDSNLRGDIGMFRIGSRLGGDTLSITTSPGSLIGAFLVDQDSGFASPNRGIFNLGGQGNGLRLNLGFNTDLKFFDTPEIDVQNIQNRVANLVREVPVTFIDDGGGEVTILVTGGDATAGGLARVLPVDGSQGVSVGRLEVSLSGGAQLRITGTGVSNPSHSIGIGRIIITNADANSSISIEGQTQVDVWSIQQTGGEAFNSLTNTTPNGDIVAADLVGLNTLDIQRGNLGRTELPAWGPRLIGPFIGVNVGQGGEVGGAIGLVGATITPFFNGGLYRALNDPNVLVSNLDDVGSPVDPYLDGLIIRTGNLTSATVSGAIGDLIAEDLAGGVINNVIANSDNITAPGGFDGIVGNIYAGNRIASVNIGDGVANRTGAPLATAGIVAADDIGRVFATRPNANISGNIIAANSVAGNAVPGSLFPTDGVDSITLLNGSFIDAYIGGTNVDAFWTSFHARDSAVFSAAVTTVTSTGGNFFRSELTATTLTTMTLFGFYDASEVSTRFDVTRIEAGGYRNSTITGRDLEFRLNVINVGNNLGVLTTRGLLGDIDDLTVDVLGRATEISARNISRSTLDADVGLTQVHTVGSLRGSSVTAGDLVFGNFEGSVRSSRITISGPIVNLVAGDSITNTHISVTGPDGRIDHIRSRLILSGEIASAGPIDLIEVTEGDLIAVITTVTNLRGVPGNINILRAARDMDIRADVTGSVGQLIAGRHIGNINRPGAIQIQGTLTLADASHGQLYSDLRVGQTIGTVLIGAVVNRPGTSFLGNGTISAFGRIETVTIEGDFGAHISSASGGIGLITINNGSLLPGASITALDGTISNVVINAGHLMGDIHADYNILSIRLNGSADGVMGDIGINPALSSGTAYDAFRNELPPNTIATSAVQGPSITAGYNIGRIILTNGSIFEAFIWAGRAIGTIDVAAGTNAYPSDVSGAITRDPLTTGQATLIAAGSTIFTIHAATHAIGVDILAGIKSFGDDGRAGGQGANADTVRSGRITNVLVDGNADGLHVSAGIDPGADGQYNTFDELVVPGISYLRQITVGGSVADVSAFADSPTVVATPGVVLAGTNFPTLDPDLSTGAAVVGGDITPNVLYNFTWGGVDGTILFTGPGQAYWDAAAGRVSLVNTSLLTNVTIASAGVLTDFLIVTNDDASMGQLTVNAGLAGESVIDIDAYTLGITVSAFTGTGRIKNGMNLRALNIGNFGGGFITGAFWVRDVSIGGVFGSASMFDEARLDILAGQSIVIGGQNSGLVQVERDLGAFVSTGGMNRAQLRVGASLGSLTAASLFQTRVSVNDALGPVTVNGSVTETAIQAGGDLGEDAAPGGTGFNADRVSTGSIASVVVLGNFTRSSIVAGALRGVDGYFGTSDDELAPGRGNVGTVTITGLATGSLQNTEQYRISATGTLGAVNFGGPGTANFKVGALDTKIRPIKVTDLRVGTESNTWTATLTFNQAMNVATIRNAISISEVRDGGATLLPLTQGVDYTFGEYDSELNSITIYFSRDVTDRNLVAPGNPDPSNAGPGVFRFGLEADVLRAAVTSARLDGDGNGFAASGEDYNEDTILGDAGDDVVPSIQFVAGHRVDVYGPVDLDLIMDNNRTPDGLPDANRAYTVRGAIGDHPDTDGVNFLAADDLDIFKITLQAGQILRLGAMGGPGQFVGRVVLNAGLEQQGGSTPDSLQLPVDPLGDIDLTQQDAYLIKTTGVYYIVLGDGFTTGTYDFTVEVFDDGDSGFAANNNAGNGTAVVNAPADLVFAGPDLTFGTSDDLTEVTIGDFIFTFDPGPDLDPNTAADNVVAGINFQGITSVRRGGDRLTSTIESAIGPAGHAGVPGDVAADVDVYHLNNGLAIAPGTVITATVKLADLGADLGSFSQVTNTDFRGEVQFGFFDTTDATSLDDAVMVYSPTDFLPRSGAPGQIAASGVMSYGYNANGDFTITFITPDHVGGTTGQAASFALYLQGAFNTDYTIEFSQTEGATAQATPQARQNVFLETRGGVVDWVQAGGLDTSLLPFASAVLGFTGNVGGMPVDQYILTNLVATLQSIFTATGLDIVVSTDPSAFEFQDFSTVYMTASSDPTTIFSSGTFGYSEHSDPYNMDHNDQSVLFLPAFATLGYTPSQADVDEFVQSLAAASGRRVGELMGLRITENSAFGANPVDIMSANSPSNTPTGISSYAYEDADHGLSTGFDAIDDTNFYLGRQNAFALLDKFLTP